MTTVAIVAVAYLIGSIPFAVIVSRLYRLPDPRAYGSGNPGATNVLRTGSRTAAALTLLGDAAKGWAAVYLAQRWPGAEQGMHVVGAAAVAVIVGHMYSAFLRLRGGKGVATAIGVMLGVSWQVAAGAIATWAIIAFFFRISSLAALVACAFVPFFAFLLVGMHLLAVEIAVALTVVALLIVWRHRANMRNLIAGTESRIGHGAANRRTDSVVADSGRDARSRS